MILNPDIDRDFRYMIKQNGAMLAKGWLLGIQFLGLFENGAFYRLAEHANRMAEKIRTCLKSQKIELFVENQTNQIFPILEDHLLEKLERELNLRFREKIDETHTAVRIVTSWDTKEEHVEKLDTGIGKRRREIERERCSVGNDSCGAVLSSCFMEFISCKKIQGDNVQGRK